MPLRSDEIKKLKRQLNRRLKTLGMSQQRAIKLYDALNPIIWLLDKIDETTKRMIAFGDEWQKDDWYHGGCAGAHGRGAGRP